MGGMEVAREVEARVVETVVVAWVGGARGVGAGAAAGGGGGGAAVGAGGEAVGWWWWWWW